MRNLSRNSRARKTKLTRREIQHAVWGIWEAYIRVGLSTREIAELVGKPASTISLAIEKYRTLVAAGRAEPVDLTKHAEEPG